MILAPAIFTSFQRFFPLTLQLLGVGAAALCADYLREMELTDIKEAADLRYFAGFVRQRFRPNENLTTVAQWEWIQTWLASTHFDFSRKVDEGCVEVHPSLQILKIHERNETLQRDAGLYAFVFNDKQKQVVEISLDLMQAQLLDLLSEDRKYSSEQLLAMAIESSAIQPPPGLGEWQKKYFLLEQSGLLRVSSR